MQRGLTLFSIDAQRSARRRRRHDQDIRDTAPSPPPTSVTTKLRGAGLQLHVLDVAAEFASATVRAVVWAPLRASRAEGPF